jgi:3D (Asp-Asp-Asp) domain-containing protein
MPFGASSMRSYTLAVGLYLVAALILRAGVMLPVPLPNPNDHRHGEVFVPGEVEAIQPYHVTAYCPCPTCCGQWADGVTASGSLARQGRTVAADTGLWGMGTCLAIPGVGTRVVEDTGSAIKWRAIDVYMNSHEAAKRFGVRFVNVEEC